MSSAVHPFLLLYLLLLFLFYLAFSRSVPRFQPGPAQGFFLFTFATVSCLGVRLWITDMYLETKSGTEIVLNKSRDLRLYRISITINHKRLSYKFC